MTFEDIAHRALAAARAAGGSPKDYGALPDPASLPLAFSVLEARVEILEAALTELALTAQRWLDRNE